MSSTKVKITDKRLPSTIQAKDLKPGTYFKSIYDDYLYLKTDKPCMSVRVADGSMSGLLPHQDVYPVRSVRVVIE